MATSIPPAAQQTSQVRAAALSGFLGTMLEYYDYAVYGIATALVFGKLFFPDAGATGTLFAFSTFALSYIARPLGAVIFGHIGDRFSRRDVLIATLVVMGLSTFLIGCLPTWQQIGIAAPIVLVLLRLVQGLSLGGEASGSASLIFEHAPEGRRGFFGSFTYSGVFAAGVLASVVFIPVSALPEDQLDSWGWRVPFWISLVITIVALWIRRTLSEPEAFAEAKRSGDLAKLPLVEAFRTSWAGMLRVALTAIFVIVNTLVTVWALSYATGVHGLDRTAMLWFVGIASAIGAVMTPVYALLSDRVGRRWVFAGGALLSAGGLFAFFGAISAHNWLLIYLTGILVYAVFFGAAQSVIPAFYSEQFPTRVRFTGYSIGLQIGVLLAGFTPMIAGALTAADPMGWVPVALFALVVLVVAAATALTARERAHSTIAEIG